MHVHVDDNENEIVKLCSDMVKIPSENPPGDMNGISSFIRSWLEDRGFTVELFEPEKGRISLVTATGDGQGPTLLLNGHMDVVPAGDPKQWEYPPFSGEVKEGKILGRGATDMKGGLSSVIAAFVAVSEVAEELSGKILLVAVPDEETGGLYGSSWLLENNKVAGDACLIGENSGIRESWIGEKGCCWLHLETRGTPAHGSLPMLGENAIEKLTRALPLIRKVEQERIRIPDDTLESIQASKNFYTEFISSRGISDKSKLKKVASALDHNTVNFGVIKGGTKINIVPESCSVEVDIRIPPGTTPENVRNHVVKLLEGAGLVDVKCDFIQKSNSNYTSSTEKIYTILKQNVKVVVGADLKPLYVTGATDGRYFRLKGIPTINYGPGELSLAHAYNEYVRVEDILKATKVIASTAVDFLQS